MLKIDFTEKAIDDVYQQFMEHPSGVTKKKLHVVYLKALGVSRTHRPVSSLQPYHDQIKAHFLKQPPHTVSEAAHEIEVLTGIKLGPSACRDFMRKRLGMKFRKMAVIPAKADPKKQAEFLNNELEPLLEEEKQGKRKVFFVDAARALFWGCFGVLSDCSSSHPADADVTMSWEHLASMAPTWLP